MNSIKPFEFGRRDVSSQNEVGSFLSGKIRNTTITRGNLALKFGLAWGGIQTTIYLAFGDRLLTGASSNVTLFTAISLIVTSIVFYFCLLKIRDASAGYLNWQQGLLAGLIFGLSNAVVNTIFSYLYYFHINPDALYLLAQTQNYGFEDNYSDMFAIFEERFKTGLMTGVPFGAISGIIISIIPTFLLKDN